ncbi:MAG: single-stranded-DNA-specific exonuclease RecJ [Candidatus Pacebacteria bacterium]|nr:single-stranded-DNA-specific exonuclease RecJ [Candidatus Paceibacterota bacterium]
MTDYVLKERPGEEAENNLARYSPLMRQLLSARGIESSDDASAFFAPDYERDVHDPFLLLHMDTAIARIVKALDAGEHIRVFSDFDADGIPAAVLMNDLFKKLAHQNFSVKIPHRNTEGFGLNERAVASAIEDSVALLITLDCGTGDAVHIEALMNAGVDVIVTDHHKAGLTVPHAHAIVNPNQEGDMYPNKGLCGAGVAFKVATALIATLRAKSDVRVKDIPVGWEKWLLDMVGIATLSDMVPLIGENRALAHYGLMVLRKSKRAGIDALFDEVRVRKSRLTEDDIVFSITPRINAASRMDEPEAAFRTLATESEAEAIACAKHLTEINNQRKGAVAHMAKEIKEKLEGRDLPEVIVVGNPHWRIGLLGLAANTIAETYGRPAFVWGRGEATVIKGSCRAAGHFDVMHLMTETKEYFTEFGGHTHSGGFSTTVEHVVTLETALSNAARKLALGANDETLVVDDELSLDAVSKDTYRDIAKLAPFGMGNPKPVFVFKNVFVERAEPFGKEKQHVRLTFARDFGTVSAIQFFADEQLKEIKAGSAITLAATLEEDTFAKGTPIRLRIVDIL